MEAPACNTCSSFVQRGTATGALLTHLHELHLALEQAHGLLDHLRPRSGNLQLYGEITRAYVRLEDVELWIKANGHLAPLHTSKLERTLG